MISDQLSLKLVAYIGGAGETATVQEWAEGISRPTPETSARLQLAAQAADTIAEVGNSAAVVQAWFQGMNPQLSDRSPARVIREGDPHTVGTEVLSAARAFARAG